MGESCQWRPYVDDPYEPGCGEPKFTEVPHVWGLMALPSIHLAPVDTV